MGVRPTPRLAGRTPILFFRSFLLELRMLNYEVFLAGVLAPSFFSVPQPDMPSLLAEAVLPAVEQQGASALPLSLQHSDLPSAIVVQPPSLPQQPLPSLLLQAMPVAEHLQPSFVPPVVEVGSALALTVFALSLAAALLALVVLAVLLALVVLVVPVLVLALQPAMTSRTKARNATNLIFMHSLLSITLIGEKACVFGSSEKMISKCSDGNAVGSQVRRGATFPQEKKSIDTGAGHSLRIAGW